MYNMSQGLWKDGPSHVKQPMINGHLKWIYK